MVVIIDWLEPSNRRSKKCCPSSSCCNSSEASEGRDNLENVPVLSDVSTMNNVVRGLNAQVTFNEEDNTVVVDAQANYLRKHLIKYVSKMRASIVVLGSCLGTQWPCQSFHAWRLYDR